MEHSPGCSTGSCLDPCGRGDFRGAQWKSHCLLFGRGDLGEPSGSLIVCYLGVET